MGSQVLLDILGALIISGTLLLTLQRVNMSAVSNFHFYNTEMVLQRDLINLVEIVENDLRRIGYTSDPTQIPTPTQAIQSADTSYIKFAGDVDANGQVDTVEYYISATSALSNTKNPRDRILYREINNSNGQIISTNVTRFRFDYFNPLGQVITPPITGMVTGSITTLQLSIEVESSDAFDANFSQAYWRQVRLSARNLQNR